MTDNFTEHPITNVLVILCLTVTIVAAELPSLFPIHTLSANTTITLSILITFAVLFVGHADNYLRN